MATSEFAKARRNAAFLGLSQVASLGLPLIELPFLARALGVEGYGTVLFVQAMAITCSVIIEYGFHYSGARRIASSSSCEAAERIVTDVLMTKIMLSLLVIPVFAGIMLVQLSGEVAWQATFFFAALALAFGFSPAWYFLGREQLGALAIFDLVVRGAGLVLIIVFVRTPDGVVTALAIQAAAGAINTLVPTIVMARQAPVGRPSFKRVLAALRDGWHLFVYKGTSSISAAVATTVLGLSSTAAQVGLFAPSEKLIRAANTFLSIVLSAFYPAAVRQVADDAQHYFRKLIFLIAGLFFLLVLCALVVSSLSGYAVQLVFGAQYADAAPLLSFLVFIVPVRVTSSALTVLWLIPAGKEAVCSRLSLVSIVFTGSLGAVLSMSMGANGMALALAIGETGLLAALCHVTLRVDAAMRGQK